MRNCYFCSTRLFSYFATDHIGECNNCWKPGISHTFGKRSDNLISVLFDINLNIRFYIQLYIPNNKTYIYRYEDYKDICSISGFPITPENAQIKIPLYLTLI